MLILLLPLLDLGCKPTSLSPGFCVHRPRQYSMSCWKLDLISEFFKRQGMLTQGPASDRKCNLIISSFLTLPHLLDCLICSRNAMSIVLYLLIIGELDRWGWLVYINVRVGGQGMGIILEFFFLCICILFSHIISLFI